MSRRGRGGGSMLQFYPIPVIRCTSDLLPAQTGWPAMHLVVGDAGPGVVCIVLPRGIPLVLPICCNSQIKSNQNMGMDDI